MKELQQRITTCYPASSPVQLYGPESLEFDPMGRGPYAGLADGRVVRWMGDSVGWETFALVTPNWTEKLCANGIHSTTFKQAKTEQRCGRPLGLRFDRITGNLYIADSYYGLMVVGPEGGLATPLATHVGGKPILFANDLDIHKNCSIFFTDTSKRYNRLNHFFILLEGEATGRLLRYDPPSKTTHVVLDGLAFPNGVQLSEDQSFLLFTQTTNCRRISDLNGTGTVFQHAKMMIQDFRTTIENGYTCPNSCYRQNLLVLWSLSEEGTIWV